MRQCRGAHRRPDHQTEWRHIQTQRISDWRWIFARSALHQSRLATRTSDKRYYLVGSTKKWYRVASSLDFVGLMDNHLELNADGAYENAASMPYYGEGSDSDKNNRSDFRREFTTAHFGGQVHLLDQKLSAGHAVGGLLVNVGPGDFGLAIDRPDFQ
jgi:hypothetical protein